MNRYESVDDYIEASEQWRAELVQLRKILQATQLEETVKWGGPCYTYAGKNIVGMGAFKSYVGLWFHQGALLTDKKKVLINAQEGKTKALRQWQFRSKKEIDTRLIQSYVKEAVQLQDSGQEIKPKRNRALKIPPQLETALGKNKKTRAGFEDLTPGRKREYAEYIADAKREETKLKRLEKIIPMIQAGRGLHDKYRSC
jgi:uncharacterized protein YdeI (YjbR/CyaY-like superfamily)